MLAEIKMKIDEKSWTELAEEVLSFGKDAIHNLAIDRENGLQVLTSILFRRVVYGFEATQLLTKHHLFTEARLQRRGMLEALFSLGALWKRPDTVSDFVKNDVHRLIKLYTNMGKTSKKFRAHHLKGISDEKISEKLIDLNKKKSGQYLSIESLAQKAGLHDLFLSDYAILSESAHHLAKDLERHLSVDENNNIKEFIVEDETISVSEILFPATDHLLMACYAINEIFAMNLKESINKISENVDNLNKRNS